MQDPFSEFMRGEKSDRPQNESVEGSVRLTFPAEIDKFLPPSVWRKLESGKTDRKLLLRANDHLRSLLYLISTYLPGNLVQEKLKRPVPGLISGKTLKGSLLFADVSGFTALSERLAVLGLEGAERLTAIMNGYFEAMLEILSWSGGILLKFAGDATLVYFPEQRNQRQALWAVRAGMRMLRAISNFSNIETPTEIVSLKMKIGVATGEFLAASVGSIKRMEYAVLGEAISQTMASEGAATSAGQLIINAATADAIGAMFEVQDQAPGFYIVELQDEELSDFEIKAEKRRARGSIPWDADPEAIVEQMEATLDQIKALRPYLASELIERVITHAKKRRFESEFRLTVVIFCNFTGPEKLLEIWGKQGTRRVTNILSDYFTAMSDVITRYGGIITRIDPYSKGTKLLALFGAPVSHQDDPLRAARAALLMNIELEIINQRWQKKFSRHLPDDWNDTLIQHRIGITLGETFAGQVGSSTRREYTVMGDDVNLSARLMGAAKPGQILLSRSVFDEIDDFFFLTQLTPIKVKGKSKPIPIYQLDGPRSDALLNRIKQRGKLVGRDDESAQGEAWLQKALNGECIWLTIQGPAGMGKSHLADTLLKKAIDMGAQVFSYQANSYNAEIPYTGWSSLLRSLAGITSLDPLLLHQEKFRRLMAEFSVPEQFFDPLRNLMGLDSVDQQSSPMTPQDESGGDLFEDILAKKSVRRRGRSSDLLEQLQKKSDAEESRTGFYIPSSFSQDEKDLLVSALVNLFQQVLARSPLVLFFEDADWLDPASCELLSQIQAALKDLPLFILLAQREKLDRSYKGKLIQLDPLSDTGTQDLVAQILISDLVQIIHEQSSGTPLYISEITHWIRETWNISTDDVRKALQTSDFLRNLVFSTLENLPESQRELAKVSSVIGNQFRLGELRALLPSTIDRVTLHHDLRGLVSARLISLMSAGVDDQYAFQQKLVRDILYNSLPYARRRDLHAKLAAYLSVPPVRRGKLQALTSFLDASVGNPINDAKIVAYHYELAEKWLLAAQNLALAADLTVEQGSHVEAAQIYEQAISDLEKASSTNDAILSLQQDLYAKRGDMAVLCADYAGAEAAYKTALASQSEEHHERVRTLKRKLALVLPILGQADDAQKLMRDVLEQEETQQNLTSVVTMTWLLWREDDQQTTSWIEKSKALLPEHSDPWSERVEILLNDMDAKWEAVVSAYRMLEQPKAAVMASLRLGDRYLANGRKEKAQEQYKKAARILERLNDQDCGLALVHYRMAEVSWQLDDQDAARNHLESAQALLISCPTNIIRKEGRTIIMEALKILKKDRPLVWPTWRWQPYDDEIKIGLLFQA